MKGVFSCVGELLKHVLHGGLEPTFDPSKNHPQFFAGYISSTFQDLPSIFHPKLKSSMEPFFSITKNLRKLFVVFLRKNTHCLSFENCSKS